jgi:aminoglycoside phosphotransferase (APT) family kinase protein
MLGIGEKISAQTSRKGRQSSNAEAGNGVMQEQQQPDPGALTRLRSEIPGLAAFALIEPLLKGWSADRKFVATSQTGEKRLLRLSDAGLFERKQAEFGLMRQTAALGIPMSQPLGFGLCEAGQSVYLLLSWQEGEDAGEVLRRLSPLAQYNLGCEAGRLLRRMHALPAPAEQEDWSARFSRKADLKIAKYQACGIRFAGDDRVIAYLRQNGGLLAGRPQTFQHGDYHIGNMIVSPDGALSVIDFNRCDFGDPWEEFNRIVWCADCSPLFATGRIDGYFGGDVPDLFFRLLAFYIASNTLSSVYWAIPFGEAEVNTMLRQAAHVLADFEDMANPVPRWYKRPNSRLPRVDKPGKR